MSACILKAILFKEVENNIEHFLSISFVLYALYKKVLTISGSYTQS